MSLRYYFCGGAGINIGKAICQSPKTAISPGNRDAVFVGLDSSGANDPEGAFEVCRMPSLNGSDELANGSGKVQSTNYPKAVPFIKDMLSKHVPGAYNVVVFSTSGGTGGMLAVVLIRELLQLNLPVVAVCISDHTSVIEMKNSVTTLRNLANQTSPSQLDRPIAFIEAINDNEHTRGQVNKRIINDLNLLSIFLSNNNEEADYKDILNLLNYNKVIGVPASLSRIKFFNKEDAIKYDGKPPVAFCSLFDARDNIVPRFAGGGYRVTGVFGVENSVIDAEEMHMTLDHGEALEELEAKIKALDNQQTAKVLAYSRVSDFGGGDSNGMNFD
ncbi:tubulin [Shewanella phage FishSpeaker]|nr:tubulin [Shewanella phage FishSpeaker]